MENGFLFIGEKGVRLPQLLQIINADCEVLDLGKSRIKLSEGQTRVCPILSTKKS
jgi:hypothetical protein